MVDGEHVSMDSTGFTRPHAASELTDRSSGFTWTMKRVLPPGLRQACGRQAQVRGRALEGWNWSPLNNQIFGSSPGLRLMAAPKATGAAVSGGRAGAHAAAHPERSRTGPP